MSAKICTRCQFVNDYRRRICQTCGSNIFCNDSEVTFHAEESTSILNDLGKLVKLGWHDLINDWHSVGQKCVSAARSMRMLLLTPSDAPDKRNHDIYTEQPVVLIEESENQSEAESTQKAA